jgi:antitoxin component YwqK of YwqJK toxin-antitoxin module
LFDSLNKEFKTDFQQSNYTIPLELLERIDDLFYFENKLFNGYCTIESFDDGRPKKVVEFKNGIEERTFKEWDENGNEIECE